MGANGAEVAKIVSKPIEEVVPQPGRMSTHSATDTRYQSEDEFSHWCADRAAKGYNSGMGEIFRKVAEISAISDLTQATTLDPKRPMDEAEAVAAPTAATEGTCDEASPSSKACSKT